MRRRLRASLSRWRALAGSLPPVSEQERWRASLGAGVGILLTALLARWLSQFSIGTPVWMAAPLGASAVLVFAVPASPLAQPWSVLGGNVSSALVGSLCAALIPDPAWAAAVAVGVAIAVMFSLRCLHPPGGATALLTALNQAEPLFAVFPMLTDSVLLVLAGVLINEVSGRRYPHRAEGAAASAPTRRFAREDLDAALAPYQQVLDVSREDLSGILERAESAAYERRFGRLTCRDIMTAQPITARVDQSLQESWSVMRARRIKALPVTDKSMRVVGILTLADFMRYAGLDHDDRTMDRLKALVSGAPFEGVPDGESVPDAVGRVMTRGVRVISEDRRVSELVPIFSDDGHHHIPVINADKQLVGIITQSDLVRALHWAQRIED